MKTTIIVSFSKVDGGFIATDPDREGLSAFGETETEAFEEFLSARELYLEVETEDAEP